MRPCASRARAEAASSSASIVPSCWSASADAVIGVTHLLRDAHAPRVDEKLAQFVYVDCVEPDVDPLVPHVRSTGDGEPVGVRGDACLARFSWVREAQDSIV